MFRRKIDLNCDRPEKKGLAEFFQAHGNRSTFKMHWF